MLEALLRGSIKNSCSLGFLRLNLSKVSVSSCDRAVKALLTTALECSRMCGCSDHIHNPQPVTKYCRSVNNARDS